MITDIKNFVKDHKKEILIGTGIILIYNLGWNRGYNSASKIAGNLMVDFFSGVENSIKAFEDIIKF